MANSTLPTWMQQLQGSPNGSYVPDGQGGYYGVIGGGIGTNPVTGESSGDPGYSYYHIAGDGNSPGQAYSIFNPDGTLQGNYTTSKDQSGFGTFAKNLAAVVGATYGAGLLGAGAGAGGAAGAADGGWGLTNAAVMGGPGTDLAGLSAAGTGATILPDAATAAGGAGGAGGLTGSSSAGGSFLGSSAGMSAPAASGAAFNTALADASGLPSWMSAAAPWLKVAAPILGAIAGSKGVKTNSTQTSNINPQVAPYVYGGGTNGGLLGGVQGLLQQQTSPQAQQGWQQVQSRALGLLSQPVAGNGFSRFFPNK